MGVFLYYLPGLTREKLTREQLAATPCAIALADCLRTQKDYQDRLAFCDVHAHGPDGFNGLIIAPLPANGEPPERIGMFPANQTWQDCGAFWIGTDDASIPTPADLERPRQVPGHVYRLGDDQEWDCPIIRRPDGSYPDRLPQRWGVNSAGKFVADLDQHYRRIWDIAGRVWDCTWGDTDIETEEVFQICIELLAVNYRIGPHEATRLGIVTNENCYDIFHAAIDLPLCKELLAKNLPQAGSDDLKKKDSVAEPSSSSPGSAAVTPTIDQAAGNTGS